MGLDMYFNKHVWIGNQFKSKNPDIHEKPEKFTIKGVNADRVSTIIEQVGYLRKVNCIHGWIVENVAEGVDDCKEVYLSEYDIKLLLDTINEVLAESKLVKGKVFNGTTWTKETGEVENWEDGKVIEDPSIAKELLPVTGGCFFGNYDEDKAQNEWYIKGLKDAKDILKIMLAENGDYYYKASWQAMNYYIPYYKKDLIKWINSKHPDWKLSSKSKKQLYAIFYRIKEDLK